MHWLLEESLTWEEEHWLALRLERAIIQDFPQRMFDSSTNRTSVCRIGNNTKRYIEWTKTKLVCYSILNDKHAFFQSDLRLVRSVDILFSYLTEYTLMNRSSLQVQ